MFKSCLQFQTVAFMPLIWRNPKILPVEPALFAGLLLHGKRDVRAMHGSWDQLSALTRVPSLPPILVLALAWQSPRTQEHPHSPYLIPPSRYAASPGSFKVLRADKEPEWFGWRQGEHSCWCSLPAKHRVVSFSISREDGFGGLPARLCQAEHLPANWKSPFPLQLIPWRTLFSPFLLIKQGCCFFPALGKGREQAGGGAEVSGVLQGGMGTAPTAPSRLCLYTAPFMLSDHGDDVGNCHNIDGEFGQLILNLSLLPLDASHPLINQHSGSRVSWQLSVIPGRAVLGNISTVHLVPSHPWLLPGTGMGLSWVQHHIWV